MAEDHWAPRLHRAVEEKLGGNWAELARRAGLTPSTLQQAKTGGDIRLSTLSRIAEALGLTIDEIVAEPIPRLGEETKDYKRGVDTLSREEEVLVEKYRHLKPSDRTRAQAIVDTLASTVVKKDKTGSG